MTLDRDTTFALAKSAGYKGDGDIYQIREWLWKEAKIFVGISNIVRGHTLGFNYSVTDYRVDKPVTSNGTATWVSLETALIEGLQKVLVEL